jgi:hypothetical protein
MTHEVEFGEKLAELEKYLLKAIKRFLKLAAKEGTIWEVTRKQRTFETLVARV